jgi:hypothetical protein
MLAGNSFKKGLRSNLPNAMDKVEIEDHVARDKKRIESHFIVLVPLDTTHNVVPNTIHGRLDCYLADRFLEFNMTITASSLGIVCQLIIRM